MKVQVVLELSDSQKRQYIDAESVFEELRRVRREARLTRGGMIWREIAGKRYLIRTSPKGAHKSLGPESEETQAIFKDFTERKASNTERLALIEAAADEQRRLNRALRVGRVSPAVVEILAALDAEGLAEYAVVADGHALCAYESACGVRLASEQVGAPIIELAFASSAHQVAFSRLARAGKPWQAETTIDLRLSALPGFAQMVVATTGAMAFMKTIQPIDFVNLKRALGDDPTRDPLKRSEDLLHADLVEALIHSHMPHHVPGGPNEPAIKPSI